MDFFEAQARARKRSARLALLFVFAVLGTVVATYLAVQFVFRFTAATEGALATELAWWNPPLFAGVTGATLAVVGIASLYKWRQFSVGGSAVAESVAGRRVDSATIDLAERRLLNVVEEMAIASGLPVPAVYILDDEPAINAFAAGLTTGDAVVAVTRGTLEKLSRDELQGVVGHEFSHILNGDMRLNVRLSALLFGILVLGLMGRGILHSLRGTRVRSRSRGKGGGNAILVIILVGLALLIIGYVGYFFGRLIQAAVSRQREFLADASAVQFTRNPGGISGALKKIAGYALGSKLETTKGGAIGHFLFAQGFGSAFATWWATHPPLPERIRAIEPAWDGQPFEPPAVVDVSRESFLTAGFGGGTRHPPDETARRVFGSAAQVTATPPPARIPFAPNQAIAATGTLAPQAVNDAQALLAALPESLRAATHTPADAAALAYGLLLDSNPAVRAGQRRSIAARAGDDALQRLAALEPGLARTGDAQKLPLLQLATPALRQLPPAAIEAFVDTLDELVHADEHVSPFEFALQRLVARTLQLGLTPTSAIVRYHSFHAVTHALTILLSVLADAAADERSSPAGAFACGAAQLQLVASRLAYRPGTNLAALEGALDTLALASLPIRQRALLAAAHVVGADGQIAIAELELLRATAAALDCPMPPLAGSMQAG